RARHEVVAGAQDESCGVFWHRKLGDRPESHAAPMIVEAAPRRHAVKIADLVDLGQREQLIPVQRERIFHRALDLEGPLLHRDVRLFAKIQHRPILHFVLADGQLRHAVAIRGPVALGRLSAKPDIDSALVELDLTLNVLPPALDEVGFRGHASILEPGTKNQEPGTRNLENGITIAIWPYMKPNDLHDELGEGKGDQGDGTRRPNGPLDGSTSGTIGGGGRETGGSTIYPPAPDMPPVKPDNAASGRRAPDPLSASKERDDLAPGPSDVSRK